ncbi:50S ribosomal protein L17 [Candidatus Phytoplasma melaleucae]|uniref:Large ribosomal subunit protein bL17 n=1 Tax=Candidatus Phytoplasma melaleucae TaxID=2982630 RepID=A0ABT9DFI6_9MOLU|nr:50S ribosomal protein L17 ['Melaleuca sp.' phytoplasma]MDO8168100.1 50S ribosomal protein L17 ['Melaleuca sp.' phytoplasma]MDV3205272.1 50S ribosomal protein L17 [Weeping tea tree witches'-broom phytoplasma]
MSYSKLRRNTPQRKSLLRSLVSDLIIHEQIITTLSKAKELRKIVEKAITLGKKNTLFAKRRALLLFFNEKVTPNQTVLQKLFNEISTKYHARIGGYTRIIKTEFRRGDSAPMAIISLV